MGSFTNFYKRVASKAKPEARLRALLILSLLLVCSLGINVVLARRTARLTTLVSRMKSESRLTQGDKVPAITARDLQGRTAVLDYAGTDLPTVLFVITPTCGWCTKNIMNMRTLAASASDRYRFVGLSLDSDKLIDYVTQNKLEFPVYTDLPLLPMKQYKLGGTPQTIVVSPKGEVLKVWSGAFAENLQKDVESYFGVTLPGIMDPETLVSKNTGSD